MAPAAARIRIPIQDGSRSSGEYIFVAVFGIPSAAVGVLSVPLLVAGHWVIGAAALAVGGFFTFAFAQAVPGIWRARPSDLVIEPDGFSVAGGAASGLRFAAAEVDTDASGFRPVFAGIDLGALELSVRGKTYVLASDVSLDEAAPILEVLRSAQHQPEKKLTEWKLPPSNGERSARSEKRAAKKAGRRKSKTEKVAVAAAAPAAADAIAILHCSGCGAALVPASEEQAICRHCGAQTTQPEALRRRMAELSKGTELSAGNAERLMKLAAQPDARAGTVVLVLALGVATLGFVAALVMVSRLVVLGDSDAVVQGLRGGLLSWALAALAVAAFEAQSARRGVIRAAALDFAAVPPARGGAPPGCHGCGAPLDVGPSTVLATCAYCRSTNIVGMTIARPTHGLERARASLESSLAERARRMEVTRKWLLGTVPLSLVIVAWAGRELFDTSAERRYDRRALRECRSVAELCFRMGDGFPEDPNKVRFVRLGCELGQAEACMRMGAWLYSGKTGGAADPDGALRYIDRSCTLGFAEACEIASGLRSQEVGNAKP